MSAIQMFLGGLVRINLISLLLILLLQTSSTFGQSECEDLIKVYPIKEGKTKGKILTSFLLTTPEIHDFTLTPKSASESPRVLEIKENSGNYSIVFNTDVDAESLSAPRIIKYSLSCSYGSRPPNAYEIRIPVQDVNDNSPVFNNLPLTATIPEDVRPGSQIYSLQGRATDADVSSNEITYQITAQDSRYANKFQISGSNAVGEIILNSSLDYEAGPRQYQLTVTALDSATIQRNSTTNLTIIVEDVDDQNPVFTSPNVWEVEENTTLPSFTVNAYDPDIGIVPPVTVKYRLLSGNSTFSINTDSGVITLRQPLDREQNETVFLFVQAYQEDKPQLRVTSTLLEVKIQDINDNPPVMSSASYSASILENTAAGVVVLQVSASDVDQGVNSQLGYHMTGQTTNAFSISLSSGQITVNNTNLLDADNTNTPLFQFQVYAEELHTVPKRRSQLADVRITLINVNDNSPTFHQSYYQFWINETDQPGTEIGRVYAEDKDSGDNGNITFTLEDVGSTSQGMFRVEPVTGQIFLQKNLSVQMYSFFVTATDQPKTELRRSSAARVMIYVQDVNNHRPRFTSQQRQFNITEGVQNYQVTFLQVVDEDSNGTYHCNKTTGDTANSFRVYYSRDVKGCVIEVVGGIDREAKSNYTLTVQVSDGQFSDSKQLTVHVTDVNDNSPAFTEPSYHFDITEGNNINVRVGQVVATDADEGINADIRYSLVYPHRGWSINNNSGEIFYTGLIDAEEQASLELLVRANDRGQPSLISVTGVQITVLDVNDNAPQFEQKSVQIWLREVAPVNSDTTFYIAQASDNDISKENRTVLYEISTGDTSLFGVTEDGRVFTKGRLNGQDVLGVSYNITIEAFNQRPYSDDSLQNGTMVVYLKLLDVENKSPVFTERRYRFFVEENTSLQTIVGIVRATDGDTSAENRIITYSIATGNDDGFFSLDSSSGEITVNKLIDFENLPSNNISFVITAQNGASGPTANGTTNVTIVVKNVNDVPPRFNQSTYTWAVEEGQISQLPKVYASDGDSPKVTYKFINNDSLPFSVNPDSGEVQLTRPLDYEHEKALEVTVIAVDNGKPELTGSAVIKVDVHNVNEQPSFVDLPAEFSVRENAPVNTVIGWLSVMDTDGDNVTVQLINTADFHLSQGERISDIKIRFAVLTSEIFDHETKKNYSFTVHCTDGAEDVSDVMTVRIVDTNDNAPSFTKHLYNGSIAENDQRSDNCLVQIAANDADSGSNGLIMLSNYSIVTGSESGVFSLCQNSSLLCVCVNQPLDYEEKTKYQLLLKATDNGSPPREAYTEVEIHVVDRNDEYPVFTQQFYRAQVPEETAPYDILMVSANDKDSADLNYSVVSSTYENPPLFEFDNQKLVLKSALDREDPKLKSNGIILLNVSVSDGVHYGYALVNLTVSDSNDNIPQFHGDLSETVARNFLPGRNILTVNVTDEDPTNTGFTFWLYDQEGIFAINSSTGVIYLAKSPSTSQNFQFQLTVFVSDHGSPPRLNQTNVNVSINESNHYSPQFEKDRYVFNITESESAVVPVGTVNATDGDGPDKNEGIVRYSIIGQAVPFAINSTSGQIRTTNKTDREVNCLYQFKIAANDLGANPRSADVIVTVYVDDVNDNLPEFENVSTSLTVASNARGRHLFTALATDLDCLPHCGSPICSLNYSLGTNLTANEGSLKIDQSGQVSVVYLRNSTIGKSFVATVSASDGKNSAAKTFTVFVYSPGEYPKVDKPANVTIPENGSNSQIIVDLNATIGTKLADQCLEYSISPVSDPYKRYVVNSSTGVVTAKPLDFEKSDHDSVEIIILAMDECDAPNPRPNRSNMTSVLVDVFVEDLDDEAPQFEKSNYNQDLSEGTPVGSTIKSVTASDRDTKPDYKSFTLSIDPTSNINGTFAINSSGNIILMKRLNIQTRSVYNLTLVVTGVHNTSLTGTAHLYIRVLDVNDNSPTFSRSSYQFSVEEDNGGSTVLGRFVGKVTANDPDQGSNGEFSYSLTYQSYPDVFNISQSGNVTTASRIDREKIEQYIGIITARDHGSPSREGTCTVTVVVSDVNDNAPQLNVLSYQGSIPENVNDAREVDIIPSISISDRDTGLNGEESVILELEGNGSELFEVRNHSVFVKASNHSQLDREATAEYNLKLKAVDENGLGLSSREADLKIRITDVNDLEPEFDQGHYRFNVTENSGGTVIGTVQASDDDTTGVIRYSIISGGDRRFYINPQSGELRVLDGLDRENRGEYVLNVTAWDRKFEPTVEVTITVLDENDNAPHFTTLSYSFLVTEEKSDATVGQVTANDVDEGMNSDVYYQLLDEDKFRINSSSGVISTLEALDREQQSIYRLEVIAFDRGTPRRNTSTTVTVTLRDVNDNNPKFLPQNITKLHASILEKTPKDSVIAWPRAEDSDEGINADLTFSLSGPGNEYFSIDKRNGLVTVKDRIDLNTLISKGYISSNTSETNATLALNVTVKDGGIPPRQTSIPLQIDIEGINDLAPQFIKTVYRFNCFEDTPSGEVVGYLDLQISKLNSTSVAPVPHYTIVDEHGFHPHFTVESLNSSVTGEGDWRYGSVVKTTDIPTDYETKAEFTLIIRAGDGKVPERSAYAVVIITIEDINDNSPICPKTTLRFSVPENETAVPTVGIVSAADRDSGNNGKLNYYFISNSTDDLEIDTDSGVISAEYPLDREEESQYHMTVLVRDNGDVSRNCTVPVIITVTDVNDNPPVFYGPDHFNDTYETSVKEDAAPSTLVFQVYANDTDEGLSGTVIYTLDPATNENFFIHPRDGKLFTLGRLDFETVTSYKLRVLAYDLGYPQLTSQSLVLVTVLDVEDTQTLQSLYEFFISGKTNLHSVIGAIQSTEPLYFNITGGNDEGTFSISPDNGQITLVKPPGVRSTPFNLTVMATNDKSPPKAQFTQVLIHVEDTVLTVVFPENQEPYQLVVDINTTEELAGQPVTYTFVNFSYPDLFNISSSTGEIYVLKELDREKEESYTLLVHGEITSTGKRKKRAFGDAPGDIRIVIEVGDENDNAPTFSASKLTFGLPRSSSFNYLIATVTATDLDEGNNSIIFYSLSEGDPDILGIDPLSGEFRCISDLSKTLISQLNAVINATDNRGQGHSVQVSVTVAVISDSDRAILVVDQPASVVKQHVQDIKGNLSAILSLDVQVESVEPHTDHTDSGSKVNPKMSDIYIHAIDPGTGEVVSHDALLRRLAEKDAEITEFFKKFDIKQLTPIVVSHEPYSMSLAEIALLCLAAVIFVGSIIAIGVVIYSARQYDFERTRNQQATNARAKASELLTNPAYDPSGEIPGDNDSAEPLELDVDPDNGQVFVNGDIDQYEEDRRESSFYGENGLTKIEISAEMKKMVDYESQELHMDLFSETTSDYGNSSISGEEHPLGQPVDVELQDALTGFPITDRGQAVGDSGNVTEVEIHSDKDSNSSQKSTSEPEPSTSFGVVNPIYMHMHGSEASPSTSETPLKGGEDNSISDEPPPNPPSQSPNGNLKGLKEHGDTISSFSKDIHPMFPARRDSSRRSEAITRL